MSIYQHKNIEDLQHCTELAWAVREAHHEVCTNVLHGDIVDTCVHMHHEVCTYVLNGDIVGTTSMYSMRMLHPVDPGAHSQGVLLPP